LFDAPAINPFSENELEILGMSGLAYITRQLQAHRRDLKHARLLVRMPPDQITPGLDRRLADAVHRYCRAKIEDNEVEIHLIRFRSSLGLGILMVVVAAIVAITYFLFTGPLAGIPQVVQVAIAFTISLFAWVSLWDPLEALIFNPIAMLRENFALRRINKLDIVVEPNASTMIADGAATSARANSADMMAPRD
jgi:membrane glycosyltransferase